MLHDPDAHELLLAASWDEGRVREAIRAIAADAEEAFDPDRLWPVHPRDYDEEPIPEGGLTNLYLGAAGVVWALRELARREAVELRRDWEPVVAGLHERYVAAPDWGDELGLDGPQPGYLAGEAGILLLARDEERLLACVRANADAEERELLWGAPGTMVAAHAMLERTGDERWADAWRESAGLLWDQWEEDGLWTQRLYGRERRFLGPAHGFAGNVFVLHQGLELLPEPRRTEMRERAATALERFATREDGLCNWPPLPDAPLDRMQWCHGAPGMVASLAGVVPDELLLAGGELTWHAGPLRKGAGLCHGTAGNGYAFLKLFERTGDELWLERARAFALHAIAQVEQERERVGRGRYSLWTGDAGTAVYLLDCLEASAGVPTLDRF